MNRTDYDDLGWPVDYDGARAVLRTGDGVDVLEVPYPAGVLAARWWLVTRGRADPIRRLPPLPDPVGALAAVRIADALGFITASGTWPWPPDISDTRQARAIRHGQVPAVRWHGPDGAVPVPPDTATWPYPPGVGFTPVDTVALLDLTARAVAAIRADRNLLDYGGALVSPTPPTLPTQPDPRLATDPAPRM